MKYSEKVKKASTILKAINGLSDGESVSIVYKGDTYAIRAYSSYSSKGNSVSYSVWDKGFRGMNVNKVGKTSLALYTYDMMSQRTTYRLDLTQCTMLLPE